MNPLITLSRRARHCFLLAAAACLFLAKPLLAAEAINGHLVGVQWLEQNLKRDDVLLLDASPGPLLREGAHSRAP